MSDDEIEWFNGKEREICYISDADEDNYRDDEDEGQLGKSR